MTLTIPTLLMETYFVVLQLPGSEELKFGKGQSCPKNFWKRAKKEIADGNSQIVSIRRDTGISEELRAHLAGLEGFTTYLIFHAFLTDEQAKDRSLLLKIAEKMVENAQQEVVDCNEHFQLVAIDHYDDHAA
ncbi:MAG: hypothetical protein ACO1N9_00815 [Flavobacterium sp.]